MHCCLDKHTSRERKLNNIRNMLACNVLCCRRHFIYFFLRFSSSTALFYDKFMLYVQFFYVDLEQLSRFSQKPANELNFHSYPSAFYALMDEIVGQLCFCYGFLFFVETRVFFFLKPHLN